MPLLGSRLNGTRFTSVLADLQAQFPVNAALLTAEKATLTANQTKFAHAIADHEGTDVVTEITANALVPLGIAGSVTSGAGSGGTTITTAPGTVT